MRAIAEKQFNDIATKQAKRNGLIEKMKEKSRKETELKGSLTVNTPSVHDIADYKKLYKEQKKEKNRLIKEIELMKQESSNERKLDNKNKTIIVELKKELFSKEGEITSLEEFIKEDKNSSKNLLLKIKEIEKEVIREKNRNIELKKSLKHKDKIITSKNGYLVDYKNLQSKYDKLLHKHETFLKKDYRNLVLEHNELRMERSLLKKEINSFIHPDTKQIFINLIQGMTRSNLNEYTSVVVLNEKYLKIKREINGIEVTQKDNEVETVTLLGYALERGAGESSLFQSIGGSLYSIITGQSIPFSSDEMLRAEVVDAKNGLVFIRGKVKTVNKNVLRTNMLKRSHYRTKLKRKEGTGCEIDTKGRIAILKERFPIEIDSVRVLIVSTPGEGNYYKEWLTKQGLNVSTIDAYEKSPLEVTTKMISADLVIVCKDRIPHSVNATADFESPKYQLLAQDNLTKVFNRIQVFMRNRAEGRNGY